MTPRVFLVNDSTSNSNWGDRAAGFSLKRMIGDAGGSVSGCLTEHQLYHTQLGPASSPQPDFQEGLSARSLVKRLIPPLVLEMPRRAFPHVDSAPAQRHVPRTWGEFDSCAARALKYDEGWRWLLDAMARADLVLIHGDGAMVGNGIIPRTDLFVAYLAKKHLGKAVAIVNHTADFDHPALREMAENVYPLFDDVVFRDPVSVERCRDFATGRFAPDSAFWFDVMHPDDWRRIAGRPTYFDVWPAESDLDPSQPYICLGGSSGLRASRSLAELRAGYRALIEHLRSAYSGQIVLTASDVLDEAVLGPAALALSLPMVGVTTPVQQAVDLLGNAAAYIGGRWHPAIFALRGGAPVVPLSSKTFKMQALIEAAGLPSKPHDAIHPEVDMPALSASLAGLLEQGSALRQRLRAWGEQMAARSWENVSYLRQVTGA